MESNNMKLQDILGNKQREQIFDVILEESCRQWCEFIEDAPERKDGEGFAEFFYSVFAEKEQEYMEELELQYNAMEEKFEEITMFGKPALFHDMRIDRNSVPKGMYLYEVRGDDDGRNPAQIAKGVMDNHFGSIIVREPIKLPPDGYLDIDPEKDWKFVGGDSRTVKEFQQTYQPVKKKEKEQER